MSFLKIHPLSLSQRNKVFLSDCNSLTAKKSPAQQIKGKAVQRQQCVVPPREILGMHQMRPTFSVWVCWGFKEISSQGEIRVSISSYVQHSTCVKQDKFPNFRELAQEAAKVFRQVKTSLHAIFKTQLTGALNCHPAPCPWHKQHSRESTWWGKKKKVMQQTSHCSSQHSLFIYWPH